MQGIRIMAILLAFSLNAGMAFGQDSTDQKNSADQKSRKELRAERLRASKKALAELTRNKTLIIEANLLRGKYQQHYQVTGDNFILIDGDRVVLQTASSWGPGFNGLGGITLEGHVTKYEYDITEERGPIRVIASVSMSGAGFGTLRINVSADGSASATYQDNWGGRVTFVGTAGDPVDSRVFEGMSFM